MKKLKKYSRTALALLLTLAAVLSLNVNCFAAYVLEDGCYVLYTDNEYTCLNVGFGEKDGGSVIVDTANLEEHEIWVLRNVGAGWVTLAPFHAKDCFLTANGFDEPLTVEKGIPGREAQWKPVSVGNNRYIFKNRSDPSCVIDCMNGFNSQDGNPFLLYESNHFAAAQYICPVRISISMSVLTPAERMMNFPGGNYKIGLYYNKNMVLNSQYGLSLNAKLVVDPYNGEAHEWVTVVDRGNGKYSLHFAGNTSLCIAPPDIFVDSQLTVRAYDGSDICLWEIYRVGSTYSLRNCKTGLFCDDWCGQTAAGTSIISYTYTEGGAPQRFYMTRLSGAASTASTVSNSANLTSAMLSAAKKVGVQSGGSSLDKIRCGCYCVAYIRTYFDGATRSPDS
ncbi:MAG: RICIN domain-containing protein, partial [Oscillibacter sp.]|nr:RICIN domain-containing protein [Oscillibacter sp.]